MASLAFERRTTALGIRMSRDRIGAQQALVFERPHWRSNVHIWQITIQMASLAFECRTTSLGI